MSNSIVLLRIADCGLRIESVLVLVLVLVLVIVIVIDANPLPSAKAGIGRLLKYFSLLCAPLRLLCVPLRYCLELFNGFLIQLRQEPQRIRKVTQRKTPSSSLPCLAGFSRLLLAPGFQPVGWRGISHIKIFSRLQPGFSTRFSILALAPALILLFACKAAAPPEPAKMQVTVIGRHGTEPGCFSYPRGIAIARDGRVAISDKTGRIQILTPEGRCVAWWTMPKMDNGTPTGIAFDETDPTTTTLVVADTHNSRILRYTLGGRLLAQWGDYGSTPGKMVYPTAIKIAGDGAIYMTEYAENIDRVLVFSREGKFIRQWGAFGTAPGQFQRPMGMALTADGRVIVADSCNHRLQLFTAAGQLLKVIGALGREPGQFNYPYNVAIDAQNRIYVVEFGNNRIQCVDENGKSLGVFGGPGTEPGLFGTPWGLTIAPNGAVWVADTLNHRLQVIRAEAMTHAS